MTLLGWGWCDTQHTGTACIGPLFLLRDLQEQSLGSQATGWHSAPPWVALKGLITRSHCTIDWDTVPFFFFYPFWSQLVFALVISSCSFFICLGVSQESALLLKGLLDLLISRGMDIVYSPTTHLDVLISKPFSFRDGQRIFISYFILTECLRGDRNVCPDLFVLEVLFILIFLLLCCALSVTGFLRVVCGWSVCSGELWGQLFGWGNWINGFRILINDCRCVLWVINRSHSLVVQ